MTKEYNALITTGTWSLVPLPNHANIVGCKWVFKVEQKLDGSLHRCKTRLVAKGFHQTHSLNYHETFSPVEKTTTIRLILCITTYFNWTLKQLHINNAFLHGNIFEDIYMQQTPGFVNTATLPSYTSSTNLYMD